MLFLKKLYNQYFSSDKSFTKFLNALIGFTPVEPRLYKPVFMHKSISTDSSQNYERLEFLGDAILTTIISEYLYFRYPVQNEGFLTELRAKIINRRQLNHIGEEMGLRKSIQVDRRSTSGLYKDITGNAFEALVGAIYNDVGYEAARAFIYDKVLHTHIDVEVLKHTEFDFKSKLYHFVQREGKRIRFRQTDEKLIDNRRFFTISVEINDAVWGVGSGYSKKSAEQAAARQALTRLDTEETAL